LLDLAVKQAKGAVFNVVGGPDLSIGDVSAAADVINAAMAPDAMIIFGALVDPRLAPGSDVTVTMVATGFEQVKKQRNVKTFDVCALSGYYVLERTNCSSGSNRERKRD